MKSHSREPIEHTCPLIDKYIKNIKYVIVKDRELRRMSESDLFEAASYMSNELMSCIDYLEEMRLSNDALRQWGINEANRVNELELQIEELESKIPII